MNTKQIVEMILTDAANNDPQALMGLVDWLVFDHDYPLYRLIRIAEKRYGIPRHICINTLEAIYGSDHHPILND